jgi:hypothetical protein
MRLQRARTQINNETTKYGDGLRHLLAGESFSDGQMSHEARSKWCRIVKWDPLPLLSGSERTQYGG